MANKFPNRRGNKTGGTPPSPDRQSRPKIAIWKQNLNPQCGNPPAPEINHQPQYWNCSRQTQKTPLSQYKRTRTSLYWLTPSSFIKKRKYDLILLQEMYWTTDLHTLIQNEWDSEIIVNNGTDDSCGVAILIHQRLCCHTQNFAWRAWLKITSNFISWWSHSQSNQYLLSQLLFPYANYFTTNSNHLSPLITRILVVILTLSLTCALKSKEEIQLPDKMPTQSSQQLMLVTIYLMWTNRNKTLANSPGPAKTPAITLSSELKLTNFD